MRKLADVNAKVQQTNAAATRVVGKLGFTSVGTRFDAGNERVVQWVAAKAAWRAANC